MALYQKPNALKPLVSPVRPVEPLTTGGLKATERLFIEKTLLRMYPRLQRHDLFPWNLFNGPLIPDFWRKNTPADLRRIVVIACGDGVLCNILSLLFPHIEIIGIDARPAQIAYAKSTVGHRKNLKFVCGNAATMMEIPCDRIIYTHCLAHLQNSRSFRKLLVKTLDWLVDSGDFIVLEAPLGFLMKPKLMWDLFRVPLRSRQNPETCLRSLLAQIGYPNPQINHARSACNLPVEVYCHSPKTLTLTAMTRQPAKTPMQEWQDWGDQSQDSLVGFLFADMETDFTRELR